MRLHQVPLFTPRLLLSLIRFNGETTRKALIAISAWGECTIDEAEGQLEDLRVDLMKLKEGNEYPPDFQGEETFASDVDKLIEALRIAVQTIKDSQQEQSAILEMLEIAANDLAEPEESNRILGWVEAFWRVKTLCTLAAQLEYLGCQTFANRLNDFSLIAAKAINPYPSQLLQETADKIRPK